MSPHRTGQTAASEFAANWPLLLSAMMGVGLASMIRKRCPHPTLRTSI